MKGRKKIIAGLTTASLLLAECAVCNQSVTVSVLSGRLKGSASVTLKAG